jgi:hypothetical protein
MNYHALCFVDMPPEKKPDLKSGMVVTAQRRCGMLERAE